MTTDISEELGLPAATPAKRGRKPGNRTEEGRASLSRADRTPEREDDRPTARIPMHAQSGLEIGRVTPGYHGHWTADVPGRLDKMLTGGYRFKTKDGHSYSSSFEGNGIDSRISKPGGGGVTLYLMEIPLELYQEDQAAKQAKANEQLASVLPTDDPDFYSRDDRGRQVHASRAARVETDNTAY